MRISKNWLSEFVTLPKALSSKDLAQKITLSSFEIDGVEDLAEKFNGVIVGEILEVRKHPNADKLQLAKVNDGKKILDIVCGAPNIAAGQKVPLATIGTYLPAVDMTIAEREVRGEKSQGMLCASDELGLGKDHSGIIILDSNLKVGTPFAEAMGFDDVILEVDNKAVNNRPDLWGHMGVAREVAALTGAKFVEPNPGKIKVEGKEVVKVEMLHPDALRYMAVKIDGIEVKESPDWLKSRLAAVGQKSINNIVDVTNYVMYELGQPMHSFDADLITDSADTQIVVRKATEGEKIKTLDDQEYKLTSNDLVIANKNKLLAIAGVMGGKESAISNSTVSIVLESANFDHVSVRKTSQRLALRTESSARFEKSLDPNLCEVALARAVELIKKVSPKAKVVSAIADVKKFKLDLGPIKTTVSYIQKRIGQDIPAKEIVRILKSLGFGVTSSGDSLSVKIPTWRATKDVSADYDLVEEVARVYGFNNIKPAMPSMKIARAPFDPLHEILMQIRPLLAYGYEMNEVTNYSFVSEELVKKIGDNPDDYVKVSNPLAKGLDVMRRSLIPNLLLNVVNNARFFDSFNLFEIGLNFSKENGGEPVKKDSKDLLPQQDYFAGGVVYQKGNKQPFYHAKDIVDGLLNRLHFKTKFEVVENGAKEMPWLSGSRFLNVKVNGLKVGIVAEVEQSIIGKLGIKERVAIFEINLQKLAEMYTDAVEFSPIPKFPAIEMDISMITDRSVKWQSIIDTINALKNPLLRNIELFDIYQGENIPSDKKSVAFRVMYRSDERTLERAEAEAVHSAVKEQLKSKLGASIREA